MCLRRIDCVQAALGVAILFAAATCPRLQAQQPAQPVTPPVKAIALDGGVCVPVSVAGAIALDWNPGFDYESVVSGIDRFSLMLTTVAEDGHSPLRPYGPGTFALRSSAVTPLTNGYYHFEFQIPRTLANGTFRVVDAAVATRLVSGYGGPAPKMTNSPAGAPFCFRVAVSPERHD